MPSINPILPNQASSHIVWVENYVWLSHVCFENASLQDIIWAFVAHIKNHLKDAYRMFLNVEQKFISLCVLGMQRVMDF